MDIVELSRLQFAVTALYHFLFVPLTLGLSVLLGIMETVYVMTGRDDLARHDEVLGHRCSASISPWASPPASPWNSSSAPTGPITRIMSATCSARRSPSKG